MQLTSKLLYCSIIAYVFFAFGCSSNDTDTCSIHACNIFYLDTLGVYDGDSTNAFMSITDIEFDLEGNLFVVDMLAGRVVKFNSELQYESIIGRSGNGPGEYAAPTSIAFENDNSFIVVDPRIQAIHSFDSDESYLGNFRLPANNVPLFAEKASENMFVVYTQTHRSDATNLFSGHSIYLLDNAGNLINEYYVRESLHGEGQPTGIAFAVDPHNERFFYCDRGVDALYLITCLTLSGDTLYQIEENYEPCQKTSEELASQGSLLTISPDPDASTISSMSYTPDMFRSPVHGLFITPEGNLLVNSGYGDQASPVFCIYDGETGNLIRKLQTDLPSDARQWLYKAHGGNWYGYSTNPDDYPKIVVFSIPRNL